MKGQSFLATLVARAFTLEYIGTVGSVIVATNRAMHDTYILFVVVSLPCRVSSAKIDLTVSIDVPIKGGMSICH